MLRGNDESYDLELEEELGMILREQHQQISDDRERELNRFRSGSAPPTVEGSLTAVGGLFGHGDGGSLAELSGSRTSHGCLSEEELRTDPAYLSYYYSNAKLNPRLPPPILSREDWRFAQRLQAGSSTVGGIGESTKVNRMDYGGRSLFSVPPGFGLQKKESEFHSREPPSSSEWFHGEGDGLIGLPGLGLGGRKKSLVNIIQDDLGHATPISRHSSRPASRNDGVDALICPDNQLGHLLNEMIPGDNDHSINEIQGIESVVSHAFEPLSTLSRSTTPDPQLVARIPSPYLPPMARALSPHMPPVGMRHETTDEKSISDLASSLMGMNLSVNDISGEDHFPLQLQQAYDDHQSALFDLQGDQSHIKEHQFMATSESGHLDLPSVCLPVKQLYPNLNKSNGASTTQNNSSLIVDGKVEMHTSSNTSSSLHFQDSDVTNAALASYGRNFMNQVLPSVNPTTLGMNSRTIGGVLPSGQNLSGMTEQHSLSRMNNHTAGSAVQVPLADPLYLQYLRTAEYAAQVAANDPSMGRNYMGNSYVDLLELQKAYTGALLSPQKSQFAAHIQNKNFDSNHGYYSPNYGMGMPYPGGALGSPFFPEYQLNNASAIRQNERNVRIPSGMRNLPGGIMGTWVSENDESFGSSLLEEFKSSKTKCFELSEIKGHVVEFSADQYGSRFIQQKLETATPEEKNMVFKEIIPHALSLMTDVFGNYVIQKFFEHGSSAQVWELANQLTGHVLTLSLQMYGCRVIQKAIEVVDLDQQIKMVAELDGHVMRCVRDQNGNHVIQKCIECIPQDAIQFIISSFYNQVVALSTHPYGCRVIQRVLEHCDDLETQSIVMDEIMQCVCMLAQDQYGNYVVQHVLEHGKPHERSAIIEKLAGQIVQMSQQKFASNVVEKCLTFGGPLERQILVNEMLGNTDENEPLQAMMKDQFANYVVQKVLETCDDQQRELLLTRIKVHLNALKKYTYGKHIVARVEKLVAAGERRAALHLSS